MLDAFIIEELKRRERKQREAEDSQRPRLELPLPGGSEDVAEDTDEQQDRNITILELSLVSTPEHESDEGNLVLYSFCH
jgi:hypothetical protein